jgi:hypothetical protein
MNKLMYWLRFSAAVILAGLSGIVFAVDQFLPAIYFVVAAIFVKPKTETK